MKDRVRGNRPVGEWRMRQTCRARVGLVVWTVWTDYMVGRVYGRYVPDSSLEDFQLAMGFGSACVVDWWVVGCLRVSRCAADSRSPVRVRIGNFCRSGFRSTTDGWTAATVSPLESLVTWLILPVVICLSQRLSHACVSTNRCYGEAANGSLGHP